MPRPRSVSPSQRTINWRNSYQRTKNGLTGFYGGASQKLIYRLQDLGLITEQQLLNPDSRKVREALGQAVTDLLFHMEDGDEIFDLIQTGVKR